MIRVPHPLPDINMLTKTRAGLRCTRTQQTKAK
jgi:hypothetical protein